MGEEKQAVRLVANKWFCFFFSFYRFLDLLQPFRRLLLGTRLRVVVQSVDALVDGLQVGHSLHGWVFSPELYFLKGPLRSLSACCFRMTTHTHTHDTLLAVLRLWLTAWQSFVGDSVVWSRLQGIERPGGQWMDWFGRDFVLESVDDGTNVLPL